MTITEKEYRMNSLTEDINLYENIVKNNPKDELSLDILDFKRHQLSSLINTPTDEDLKDNQQFEAILKRQQEVVTSVITKEKQKVNNIVIYFNGKFSKWEIIYTIDGQEKIIYYNYNESFLKAVEESYNKLIKRYGKRMLSEYDKIICGVLSEVDVDLQTNLLQEFLNNNNTFKILYDFRELNKMSYKLKNKIKRSYKKTKVKSNAYSIHSNKKSQIDLYNSIMKKVETNENVVPIKLSEEAKDDNVIKLNIMPEKEEKRENRPEVIPLSISVNAEKEQHKSDDSKLINLRQQLNELKNINFDSYVSNKPNNMSLDEILKEDDEEIEILDEFPTSRNM